jgi:predicted transcriptional regulator
VPIALDDVRDRLNAISDELGDLSIQVLREALDAGATTRPDLDKRLGRARAAVDKAIHLLEGAG